jgi:hypothetical protein
MFDTDLKAGLMNALKFTPEDLAANQTGVMSAAQKAQMGKSAGFTRVITLIMFVVMILIFAAIGAYVFVFSGTGKSFLSGFSKDPTVLYIVGGVMAVVVLIIFFSFLRTLATTNNMTSGKVKVIEGNAKMKSSYTGYGMTSYTIQIGKAKFYVQKEVFDSFAENSPYRVYYVKSTVNMMVSAEML